jgi:hypothetical protein
MATVAASPTTRKAPRAYRAIQDETPGTLTQLDGILYFFSDAGEFTTVEPAHLNFLTVLGEIGLYETQAIVDQMHGGAAWIATHRAQEVA